MKWRTLGKLKFLAVIPVLLGLFAPVAPAVAEGTNIDLVISPATLVSPLGSTFNLTVEARCGSQVTDGIMAFIDFDPVYLEALSAFPGDALPLILSPPAIDNAAGTLDFSFGQQLPGPPPGGTFTVLTITFHAKKITPVPTLVTFHNSDSRVTWVDREGFNIAGNLSGGEYSIGEAELTDLDVLPSSATLFEGGTQQFSVVPTYSDGTHQPVPAVTWNCSDTSKAAIFANGLGTALATAVAATPAPVKITAAAGNIRGQAYLDVISKVNLAVSPATLTLGQGTNFTATIEAQCGSQVASGIDLYLDFDPLYLEVLSAQPGSSLSVPLKPVTYDNVAGTLEYSAGQQMDSSPVSGTFTLLSISFKAKSITASSTPLSFSTSSPRVTMAVSGESNVTGSLSGGLFTIREKPMVVSAAPASGSTGVAVSSPVTLAFNKAMDQPSTQNAFSLTPPVSGNFSWNLTGAGMTFTPAGNLSSATNYSVNLSASAKDTDGISLAAPFSYGFTTASGGSGGGSGGGGGGGGGGGAIAPKLYLSGFSIASPLNITSQGVVQTGVKLESTDEKLTLEISAGTRLLTSSNSALSTLGIIAQSSPPVSPDGQALVLAYSFTPEGAKFDPGLVLTFKYSPAQLPSNVAEKDLYLAYFDGKQWQKLDTSIDTANGTATAIITHFSIFALLGKISPPAATPSPVITPSATPSPTPAAAITPSPSAPVKTVVAAPVITPSPVTPTPASTPAAANIVASPSTAAPTTGGIIAGTAGFPWAPLAGGIVVVVLIVVAIAWRTRAVRARKANSGK